MNFAILKDFTYGMYALGYKDGDGADACIVNSAFQVSSDPVRIAVSVNVENHSNKCIKENKYFTLSVLSEDTSGAVIGALGFNSGKNIDKLKNVRHRILKEGVPIIKENNCSWVLCKLVNSMEMYTHTIFIGEIVAGSEKTIGVPMTYKYYTDIINGVAPQNSPIYQKNERQILDIDSYVCKICGYVYNNPQLSFGELPDNWLCPVCGVNKDEFTIKR